MTWRAREAHSTGSEEDEEEEEEEVAAQTRSTKTEHQK